MVQTVHRPPIADTELAIKAYYSDYIGNKTIQQIFKCGATTTARLKRIARDLEIERDKPTIVLRQVNARIAFEAWQIDIDELIKNRQKLMKLGL